MPLLISSKDSINTEFDNVFTFDIQESLSVIPRTFSIPNNFLNINTDRTLTISGTNYTIPVGHYRDIFALINKINSVITASNVSFSFDATENPETTNRVSAKTSTGTRTITHTNLLDILGFRTTFTATTTDTVASKSPRLHPKRIIVRTNMIKNTLYNKNAKDTNDSLMFDIPVNVPVNHHIIYTNTDNKKYNLIIGERNIRLFDENGNKLTPLDDFCLTLDL